MLKIFRKIFSKPTIQQPESDQVIMDVVKKITTQTINIIFDVGAHHGKYSDLGKKNFNDSKFYLFEPFINAFNYLTTKYNDENFIIENLAISGHKSLSKFYSNVYDETNSLLPANRTNTQIDELTKELEVLMVEVTTLDEYCKEKQIKKIDLLKIDTQGNTLNVLKGAEGLLKDGLIGIIQCEVEFIEIYQDQALFFHVAAYLDSFGYELYSIYKQHFEIDGRLSWADAIFQKQK